MSLRSHKSHYNPFLATYVYLIYWIVKIFVHTSHILLIFLLSNLCLFKSLDCEILFSHKSHLLTNFCLYRNNKYYFVLYYCQDKHIFCVGTTYMFLFFLLKCSVYNICVSWYYQHKLCTHNVWVIIPITYDLFLHKKYVLHSGYTKLKKSPVFIVSDHG